MYLGLASVVKFDSTTIVAVTQFTPPATEFVRVDISALSDTKEQATLGRQMLQEIDMVFNWKPAEASHGDVKTKAEAKTEFDLILEFTAVNKKWTCTDCKIQRLGSEQVTHDGVLRREVKLCCNGTVTEASIT